jgi:hypothetical protein
MEQLWQSITAGAAPLILSALAMLIPAAAAYALAWLKAQTALQEQAVRSAVDHVDALKAPAAIMPGDVAKDLAMRLVAEKLGARAPRADTLSAQIQRVVDEKRRASVPPGQP